MFWHNFGLSQLLIWINTWLSFLQGFVFFMGSFLLFVNWLIDHCPWFFMNVVASELKNRELQIYNSCCSDSVTVCMITCFLLTGWIEIVMLNNCSFFMLSICTLICDAALLHLRIYAFIGLCFIFGFRMIFYQSWWYQLAPMRIFSGRRYQNMIIYVKKLLKTLRHKSNC